MLLICVLTERPMNEYQIAALLARLQAERIDQATLLRMYAETLASVADRLTDDEMKRFLFCGTYLRADEVTQFSNDLEQADDRVYPSWRGNQNLN